MNLIKKFCVEYWNKYKSKCNKKHKKILVCLIISVMMIVVIPVYIATRNILRAVVLAILFVIFNILVDLIILAMFEIPKYYLREHISNVILRIDQLFNDKFYKSDYSQGDKVFELKKKVNFNLIPSEELLNIWYYKLKLYRQSLITIVPASFYIFYKCLLILSDVIKSVNLSMIQLEVPFFISLNNFIDKIILNSSDPYIDYRKIFEFLALIWLLLVYHDEIQKANESIFKVELLKDLIKITDKKEKK